MSPDRPEPTPGANLLIAAFGRVLASGPETIEPVKIVTRTAKSPVERTGTSADKPGPQPLGEVRAARVRDQLARALNRDGDTIETRSDTIESDRADPDVEAGGIEIELRIQGAPPVVGE